MRWPFPPLPAPALLLPPTLSVPGPRDPSRRPGLGHRVFVTGRTAAGGRPESPRHKSQAASASHWVVPAAEPVRNAERALDIQRVKRGVAGKTQGRK